MATLPLITAPLRAAAAKLARPLTWLADRIGHFAAQPTKQERAKSPLDYAALRKAMHAASPHIPAPHMEMLVSVLGLGSSTVEDVMTPRPQIAGIDLEHNWADIQKQLAHSPFTRMLVYEGNLDNTLGFLHLRRLLPLFAEGKLDRERLRQLIRPAYFVPEGTSLTQQLLNFKEASRRTAIVVDEYGDILGLLTMEDILEEIVGEFSTVPASHEREIQAKEDGSFWLDGATHLREVNRVIGTDLPTDGPKTVNGLIVEHLESIPVPGMTVLINGYPMEICKTRKNAVKSLIIYPRIERKNSGDDHG